MKAVIRYLEGTAHTRLTYQRNGGRLRTIALLQGFAYEFFAGKEHNHKSTNCTAHEYNGRPFVCMIKINTVMALSTAESKNIALDAAAQNLALIRALGIKDGIFADEHCGPGCDNLAVWMTITEPRGTIMRNYIDFGQHKILYLIWRHKQKITCISGYHKQYDMPTNLLQRFMFQNRLQLLYIGAVTSIKLHLKTLSETFLANSLEINP